MADEFIKGLGVLTGAGMVWFSIAAWFNTPSFEGQQLIAPNPDPATLSTYGQLLLTVKDAMFWFAILGAVTFWIVLPALRVGREYLAESGTAAE